MILRRTESGCTPVNRPNSSIPFGRCIYQVRKKYPIASNFASTIAVSKQRQEYFLPDKPQCSMTVVSSSANLF